MVAALQEAWGDRSAGSQGSCTSSMQDLFRRRQLFVWKNKCAFTNLSTDQGSLQACRIIPLRAKFHSLDLGWEVRLRGLCECSYSHVGPARGTQSGKEMLGHLSTDQGKMWVLHHLGCKHGIHIHTLNHPSNGFLAVQVCLLYAAACVRSPADRCQRCQHMDAFPRMSTRGLTPADCLLTCSATHLSWWCGTRDTFATPACWTGCTANRCLAVPSSWARVGPQLSLATCSHSSSGSAQLCMRLRGFVTAGVKSSPPVFTAALCVTMVRRKLTRRPALSRTYPATTSRHKVPTSWWCRCMTRPTHHQQRHASGAQAGVARDGFKLCCQ